MPTTERVNKAVTHLAVVLDELNTILDLDTHGTDTYAEAHHARQHLSEALIALAVPADVVFDHPQKMKRAKAL